MQITPYLYFDGRCDDAIAFYKQAIAAEVTMLMRYKDLPPGTDGPPIRPDMLDKVMHAQLRIGGSDVMVADGHCTGTMKFDGFAMAVAVPDVAAADRAFAALSDGGKVLMPLAKTFYSPKFGMTTDRFGVLWSIMVGQ